MPFAQLMRDNVDLEKATGGQEANLRASVQGNLIFMAGGKLPIEAGDVLVRKLSTGAREAYRVLDPGFHEGLPGIAAHYQMKVIRVEERSVSTDDISEERKLALYRQWDEIGVDIIKQDLGTNGGIRYVGGPPATRQLAMQWVKMREAERERERINVQVSGANARVNIHSSDHSTNLAVTGDLFTSIRDALANGIADPAERARVNHLLADVEAAKDKTGFLSAYQKLIGAVADHMTVFGPFLPALTHLLHGLSG